MENFIERIIIPYDKVIKKKNTFCVEKKTLKINGNYPEYIYIKFKWSQGLDEYINFQLFKLSKKTDSALYKSTLLGQKLLVSNVLHISKKEGE